MSKVHLSYLRSNENAHSIAWTEALALMKIFAGSWGEAINCWLKVSLAIVPTRWQSACNVGMLMMTDPG
jgi:hypothetical protein